jgi:hypothetical protein
VEARFMSTSSIEHVGYIVATTLPALPVVTISCSDSTGGHNVKRNEIILDGWLKRGKWGGLACLIDALVTISVGYKYHHLSHTLISG